jgi:hypothetical protein
VSLEDLQKTLLEAGLDARPKYYRRDGTPYISTPEKPDFLQWAEMFENTKERMVAVDKTLYGERLSTVFLGLDHSFEFGPHVPILYETMLFAPRSERSLKKNYPHDQLQLRYATEREASDRHEELKLQCLIPPRWRRFLLYTIGEDAAWE